MSGSVAFVEEIEVPNLLKKQPSENVQHLHDGDNSFVLTDESNPEASVSSKCEDGQVLFPNRDVYSGMLADCIPTGFGKYVWSDGCMYEGEWDRGMITGQGKFSWPSGATYEGEFSGGFMHGSGTYVSPNTLTYKGDWRFNVKHGSGRKNFANGDVYEGSWIDGVIEGPGKYVWANGSVYTGNMKGGKMSGKGFFTWSSGDSFEGNWMGGVMHGFGVYTWADGGCYVGTWSRGLKDGKGTFYPYGGKLPGVQQLYQNTLRKGGILPSHGRQDSSRIRHASSVDLGSLKLPRPRKAASSPAPNHKSILQTTDQIHPKNVSLERRWSFEGALEKVLGLDGVSGGDALSEENDEVDSNIPVLEREYMQGVLISELVISTSLNSRSAKRKQKKLAKEYKRPGEAIIKGHRSYDLMLNLQLGIRYTVGKITPIQRREVRASDFGPRACFWMSFPKEGSQLTPPHKSVDFKWKDYCPMVFRNLREMFKIDAADYMISICGSAALRELSSPGKSGSVFFLSQDDRFMIKTLRKSELHVLLRMLPNYHHHVRTYENTLITKFFGLHRIKTAGGQKFRFVVMGNMFCTELRIHRRYDLKGSSQGRSTNKIEIDETTTLKDLDLNYQFYLEASWRESLLKQIRTDCQFLKIQQIMDYSLLLGVHYRAPQYLQSFLSDKRQTQRRLGMLSEEGPDDEISGFPQSLILVPLGSQGSDVVVGPHIRGSRLRAAGDEEVDLLLPGTARLQIQLGVNMPARAERITREEKGDFYHEAYDVVIYLGIIDILQEYNVRKKFEHACKSLQYDSSSISAVDPDYYAQRFLKFIQFVFPTIS